MRRRSVSRLAAQCSTVTASVTGTAAGVLSFFVAVQLTSGEEGISDLGQLSPFSFFHLRLTLQVEGPLSFVLCGDAFQPLSHGVVRTSCRRQYEAVALY